MSDLKSCPFCGSGAEWDQDSESHPHKPIPNIRVRCRSGNCPVEPMEYISQSERTYSEVESGWNTRPSPWVSVKDRLPEDDGTYLVSATFGTNRQVGMGGYDKHKKRIYEYSRPDPDRPTHNVTHWMPIPELETN